MKFKAGFGFTLVALMLSGTAARADNLDPACTANTLAYYESLTDGIGGGCSVGIENFSNFAFGSAGSSMSLYTASQIEVTPSALGDGFTFNLVSMTPFMVASGQTATYDIEYTFFIDPGPSAGSASETMDPPFGNVVINQFYCKDGELSIRSVTATPSCSSSGQTLSVNDNNPPTSWTTGIVPLVPPVLNFANVLTMINLDGTQGAAGFDDVTGVTFTTAATPEPSTILFAAGGLLAIALRRRFC